MQNVMSADETYDISNLSSTVQDYLSLIYVMERDNEPVMGVHLAEMLGVTPPTVTNTLKRMTRDGLLTMTSDGTHLTETGWKAARAVMRRHMLTEWMMLRILPWSKLHAEAHHLEHAISNMTETALLEELHYPKTCPHGNPLPGCEDYVANWVALTRVEAGTRGIVRRIHEMAEENNPMLSFLDEKRVVPGQAVTVTEILPFNQTVSLKLGEGTVTLGYAVAKYVYIEIVT